MPVRVRSRRVEGERYAEVRPAQGRDPSGFAFTQLRERTQRVLFEQDDNNGGRLSSTQPTRSRDQEVHAGAGEVTLSPSLISPQMKNEFGGRQVNYYAMRKCNPLWLRSNWT